MAVFIAILDDDPADRKQSERLLSRERDARVRQNEVIYFDTYGSREAILPYCTKYDLFLIDISHSSPDGFMTAVDLTHHGAAGRMVLASSTIDYRSRYKEHEDFIFIEKPLYQRHISELVDIATEHRQKQVPRLEIRGEKDTIYVTQDEILYLKEQKYYTIVALTGDRTFHMSGGLGKICRELSPDRFIYIDNKTIINTAHVASHEKNTFRMSDGAVIRFSIFNKAKILKAWQNQL